MKNKYLFFSVLFALFFTTNSIAQERVCGTYEGYLEEDMKKYPEFYNSLEDKNNKLEQKYKAIKNKFLNMRLSNSASSKKKIIPVVVHVIHDGTSSSNLTEAQIQNGIDELNANINGQGWNFLSVTPDVFAAVRGVGNVEFRLAKIDPDGNPTNGIVRVKSSKTIVPAPRNQIKALSYWNSYQYFNIWTVQSMPSLGPDNPALNGYAQFPNTGSMSTDGVVIRAAELAAGTTITHEVGHWLGLCHTWDCGGATCGTDNVADTPEDLEGTFDFGFNDNFPFHVGFCIADSMNWAGEMYMNYMDYQSDAVGTMFTKGQVAIFNEHLEGVTEADPQGIGFGYREYIWQEENLINTGTYDGYKPPACTKKADFNLFPNSSPSICVGENVSFQGNKSVFGSSNVSSFVWDFGNGDIDNSGTDNPTFSNWNEGSWDVSLTVEYNETTKAVAYKLEDIDVSGATLIDSVYSQEMVQGTQAELVSLGATGITEINIDSLGVYFGLQDSSFFRGYITKVKYEAYYQNTCNVSVTKEDFITVYSPTTINNATSYKYSFENDTDLGNDWVVTNTVSENAWDFNSGRDLSWQRVTGVAVDGGASIKLDGSRLAEGSHEIISSSYDLSNLTTPAIKFSYSGAALNTFPENEFKVWYSTDCGESWYKANSSLECCELGSFSAIQTANSGLYATSFSPNPEEWSTIILTKPQLKNSNVRFKFEYIANENSNNFFLDNIEIGEEASLLVSNNLREHKLTVFPNPSKGSLNMTLENFSDKDIEVYLTNILGEKVNKIYEGKMISDFYQIENIDLIQLKKGIYFIQVIDPNNTSILLTDKVIINK
ncbi:MAG: hypothetical protein CMD05_05445 [Flavobacteriales bacterium]|nr:hypothetical protein [Flavobacteriales bacterium]